MNIGLHSVTAASAVIEVLPMKMIELYFATAGADHRTDIYIYTMKMIELYFVTAGADHRTDIYIFCYCRC